MFNLFKINLNDSKTFQPSELFPLYKRGLIDDEAVEKAVAITNLVFQAQNNKNTEEASQYAQYHYTYLSKLKELDLQKITGLLKEMLIAISPDIIAKVALYYECGWCTHNKPINVKNVFITTIRLKNALEIEAWRQELQNQENKKYEKQQIDKCCCFVFAQSQLTATHK